MKKTISRLAVATALAGAALAAQAQPATNGAPASVGVSQGTAADAASKAVPRSDTGTLVRTAPTAADRTRAAADSATSNSGAAPSTAQSQGTAPMTGTTTPTQRAPRADRN